MTFADLQAAVLDASVGIKLFLPEDGSEQADHLFSRLAADPPASYFVPDLFYIECANILWKYVQRFGYPLENARQDVHDLHDLALRDVPTVDLAAEALELALELKISAYDTCYAALARRLELPLVSADVPLARKLASSGIKVLSLWEYSS
jgi:predicted nucleic acid-binding protein